MSDAVDVMQVALRVLQAVNRQEQPTAADVEELRRAVPEHPIIPADELACDAIKFALKARWKRAEEAHSQRRHLKTGT